MSHTTTATLTVNGQAEPYAGRTLRELLQLHQIDPDRPGIAVALNDSVVPRASWATLRPQPADRVEIVHARAGG